VAGGSEFELPVPLSKLSDDSIKVEFTAARRIAPYLGSWPERQLDRQSLVEHRARLAIR
jgi:hypothetical protein